MHAVALTCIPFFYLLVTAYNLISEDGINSSQTHLLPSINTTIPDHSIPSNASLVASNLDITCFDNVPDFLPVTMANYFAAVQQILIREDALVPRPFYLGPSPEVRWEWTGGATGDDHQCIIVLFNTRPLLTDPFPIMLIAQVAAMIADDCITARKNYAGGMASPGVGRGIVAVMNSRRSGGRTDGVYTER